MDIFASSSCSFKFTFVFILAVTNFPTSLCRHSKEFKACSQTFSCGNLTDISYPFYGLNRPAYCGHPGFELLDCDQNTIPIKMKILSQEFFALGINSMSSTINVTREDFYTRSGCPSNLANITIDFSIFQYTPTNVNVTLLYGDCASACNNSASLKAMTYSCPMSPTVNLPVCFLTEKMMLQSNISQVRCPKHLFLPVHLSDNTETDKSGVLLDVSRGAWHGFELKWIANNDLCKECLGSGGHCGHDWQSNKFFCFCGDESQCPFPGATSDSRSLTNPKIAILASFSAMGILILVVLVFYFKKNCLSQNQAFEVPQMKRKQDIEAFMRNYRSPGPKRYTYTDLKKITNSFKDKLGQGGYSVVYRGKLQSGNLVAVKILKKLKADAEEFINEVASIGQTNHVNVVTLLGFCYEGQKRALVYEFMHNGSLEKFVYRGDNHESLAWGKLFQVAVGIARGLEYLHRGCNTRILHLDIKPHNILLDENFCPKISDFGLARSCPQSDSITFSMSETRGTVGYIAPEVFLRSFGGVSYKSDVYSYGMLVLEMVGCRKQAEVEAEQSHEMYFPQWIYKQLEKEEAADSQEIVSYEEREMQRKMILVSLWCVQTSPSNRPAMGEVVDMLEGPLESLQIPPTASLSSSVRSKPTASTTSTISI